MLWDMSNDQTYRRSRIRNALASLGILALIIVALWWLVRSQQPPRELRVYDALLEAMEISEAEIVLVSAPDICDMSEPAMGSPRDLVLAYQEANSSEAMPISLRGLEGAYRYVSHQSSLRNHPDSAYSLKIDEPWLGLSRVGFYGNTAMLCVSGEIGQELSSLTLVDGEWKVDVRSL